ncbi:MAG: hypothetical protein C5B54_10940 [Acidobacteria bacterium]|nr:MAG: hypothetical protein C5B54_10940 [Acidobacteriota bacterium]
MRFTMYGYEDMRGERSRVMPDLNRSALAKDIGVSRSQLSRILNGKVDPPVKTLRLLADALEASLDEVDAWLKELKNGREYHKRRRRI